MPADFRSPPRHKSTHIAEVGHRVPLSERWRRNGHKSGVLWLTGLSGAGKTTLSLELEQALFNLGWQSYVLDGDNIRHGVSADLGFSAADREENIRRVGEVAALFAGAGLIVITAFISPYRADRARAREAVAREIGPNAFHEVFVSASLAICEERDPKGLYAKARRGEIADFTGISAPYEAPIGPELTLETGAEKAGESTARLLSYAKRAFSLY